MKKINHSVLIVSVAAALFILGISFVLGTRFGLTPGLLTGVGAFTLLISLMLFANRRLNKKNEKQNGSEQEEPDEDKNIEEETIQD